MGGVDRHDQKLKYYSLTRKSLKWYKKFFFHLLDMCVFNASCIYRKNNPNVKDLQFRERLIQEILDLTGPHHTAGRSKRVPTVSVLARLNDRHFPDLVPLTERSRAAGKKHQFRQCHVCSLRKERTLTPYMCNDCDVSLCAVPCFGHYHTRQNLI